MAGLLCVALMAACDDNAGAADASAASDGQAAPSLPADAGFPLGDTGLPPQPGLDAAIDGGARVDGGAPADAAVEPTGTGPFPPVSDFGKAGPYTPTSVPNVGPNGNFTLYHPKELAPAGAKNPIVSWMNGGGTTNAFYGTLPHLASHGFFVIASNTLPSIGDEVALGKEIIAGLDWAIAEAARADGPFYGKLDTVHVAAMGYSMGSLATFTIAQDLRLTTTVHISGGNMAPERVANLHAPAAFICGIPGDASCGILDSNCDIAAANCDSDFKNAKTPVFYANFPGGHLGILTGPHDMRIAGMAAAWLRYKLMADASLSSMFLGSTCTYCTDSYWKVQQKLLP